MAARAAPGARAAAELMPRPVDKELVTALQHIKVEAVRIHQRRPTIGVDDVINALTFSEGRTLRAAEIIETLHRRRSVQRRNED
jgi:hypothetical protein